jgi:hypothetical protein
MIHYITNLKNNATTQRRFDFNSMFKFNGKVWFTNSTGLNTIGGNDDNGADIDAYFEPVTTDFGVPNPKRARFVHLGFETDGDLEVDVSFDGSSSETLSFTPQSSKTGQQRMTVAVSRTYQGRYFTTQIRNVDGADFAIDGYDVEFYTLSQRIQDY